MIELRMNIWWENIVQLGIPLFIFIGYVYSKFQNKELLNLKGNQELYNSFQLTDGGVVFFILVLLAFTSIIKSLYQFYLYRTV